MSASSERWARRVGGTVQAGGRGRQGLLQGEVYIAGHLTFPRHSFISWQFLTVLGSSHLAICTRHTAGNGSDIGSLESRQATALEPGGSRHSLCMSAHGGGRGSTVQAVSYCRKSLELSFEYSNLTRPMSTKDPKVLGAALRVATRGR